MLPANAPVTARPYRPGPREHCRRLAQLVARYYQVHAHLPGRDPMPLSLENMLVVAQMPCSAAHPEEEICPDCSRLLAELIAAVRQVESLRIWSIVSQAIAQIESSQQSAPAARTTAESPTRRAAALLPSLARYHPTLHRPCEHCGSLLFYERDRHFYCFLCSPLPNFPAELAASIQETCATR